MTTVCEAKATTPIKMKFQAILLAALACGALALPAPAPEGMEWTATYGSYPLNYYRSYPLAYRYYTAPLAAPLTARIAAPLVAPLTARIAAPIVAPLTVDAIKSYEADDFASMYGFYPSAK